MPVISKLPKSNKDKLIVGNSYKLNGTTNPKVQPNKFLGFNNNLKLAIFQSEGFTRSSFNGINELSSNLNNVQFIGDFVSVASNFYLPRVNSGNAGCFPSGLPTPTYISVHNGSSWVDEYSDNAKNGLIKAAQNYQIIGGSMAIPYAWIGVCYESINSSVYIIGTSGEFSTSTPSYSGCITAPCFTIQYEHIKVQGDTLYYK